MDKAPARTTDRIRRRVAEACRDAASPADLFRGVQQALAGDLPADRWCALTLDPATALPTGGVHEQGLSPSRAKRLLELEYGAVDDVNLLIDLARAKSPAGTLAAADRSRSARYREVLAPDGMAHELRAVFRDSHGPWAAMVLMRGDDRPDFDTAGLGLMDLINEPVTRALRRLLLLGEIEAQAQPDGPALLLVQCEGELQLRHASAAARHWLAQIEDTRVGPLPYALYSLAANARRDGHGVARMRTRTGRWLTAHAEAAGAPGEVSLILQPSRPHEIAQVMAAAYGLTAREAEVARLVAAGCGNAEIAGLLFVSRYTVEDHLKKSYEKLGVGSRGELVSRLFFDQYLPRTGRDIQLDGAGWFLPPRGKP